MKSQKVSSVFETYDYDMFTRLVGNRSIGEGRILAVMESINEIGQMKSPILVNENAEVIDGQARLEAFKRMHLPVYYVVADGVGIKECISMNIKQSNWSITDYIDCFADLGNQSYMYVKDLIARYKATVPMSVILWIAARSKKRNESFKTGKFVMLSDEYQKSITILDYISMFASVYRSIGGRIEAYYMATAFCFGLKSVDTSRLYDSVVKQKLSLVPVANVEQALEIIERIYNYRIRGKVYITEEWKKYNDQRQRPPKQRR